MHEHSRWTRATFFICSTGFVVLSTSGCTDKQKEQAIALSKSANPILTELKSKGAKLGEPLPDATFNQSSAEAALACKEAGPIAKRLSELPVAEGHPLKIVWELVRKLAENLAAGGTCVEKASGADIQCTASCIAAWQTLVKNVEVFRTRAKEDGADFVSLSP